jgi:phosphomannomutase/phosphoglucomutase
MELSASIFKAYDIRGVIDKTLDPSIAKLIGQSFGSAMKDFGRDYLRGWKGRPSIWPLTNARFNRGSTICWH